MDRVGEQPFAVQRRPRTEQRGFLRPLRAARVDARMMADAEEFVALKPRLFGVAYRMLGSVADAEDMVQEAFLRWQAPARSEIRSAEAFLTTVVVRLSLDELRSARARRETYVGPWLPEPLLVDESDP